MTSYVYLHGFASSPASSKAQYFKARFAERGIALAIPELDGGDFEHLTLSGQLSVIGQAAPPGDPIVLLGSSMGGYLAALYAEHHAEVERLVLLAPAFDFQNRWALRLGEAQMAAWRSNGVIPVFHYGRGVQLDLAYDLFEDASNYPSYPDVSQPTLILQGADDDVVVPDVPRHFCRLHPQAEFHLFPSGHELTNVLPELWAATEAFLFS